MARTTYQITVTEDGRQSVVVTSDDPVAAKAAAAWAKQNYDALLAEPDADDPGEGIEETPVCPIHHEPMVRQQGRYGPFWSCHKRNPDGSFCSYRPTER